MQIEFCVIFALLRQSFKNFFTYQYFRKNNLEYLESLVFFYTTLNAANFAKAS